MAPGLYVHIPFCSIKCFYCDFTAFSGQNRTIRRYLSALKKEAGLYGPVVPRTLYIGGGTPSELSAPDILALFSLVRRAFPKARFKETTFEANPESLTPEKLEALRRSGVSRLSLGLQTADDALLRAIGRKHTRDDFLSLYRAARRVGGFDLSVDLMYGMPGQTTHSHLESLKTILALAPEHISLYGLQVEDRTLFAKRAVEADEDLSREMFEASLDLLESAGYRHYEISNFAKPGHESVHNRIYWNDGEYLGLGCGAASHLAGERRTNLDRLIPYCEAVESGRKPLDESESLSGRRKLGERALLGLRLVREGLDLTPELKETFAPQWRRLESRRLVRREGSRARLTREGIFLANEAFREFVLPFDDTDLAPRPSPLAPGVSA